jgi:hypothetical protein
MEEQTLRIAQSFIQAFGHDELNINNSLSKSLNPCQTSSRYSNTEQECKRLPPDIPFPPKQRCEEFQGTDLR